jgi:hypothetical protein
LLKTRRLWDEAPAAAGEDVASVDVTGERSIASQIAFGEADRRAQEPIFKTAAKRRAADGV